jgi:hypothetical protein
MFSPVMTGHHGGYLVTLEHPGLNDGCPIRNTIWEKRDDALRFVELMSRTTIEFGRIEVHMLLKAFKNQARLSADEMRLRDVSWDKAHEQLQDFFDVVIRMEIEKS